MEYFLLKFIVVQIPCVNVSPGGSIGVSCSEDETLRVWQTEDGSIRRSLEGHISDVTHCRFFPSGSVVLSGGIDMRVKIWSVEDGSCPVTFVGHTGAITDSAIIDRGRNIITCSRDGSAILWDCGSAASLYKFTTNSSAVINSCALINHKYQSQSDIQEKSEREVGTEGRLLVLARDDGIIEGVDVQSRDKIFQCVYDGAITSCSFINENRLVAGQQNGNLVCIDLRNTSRPEKVLRHGKSAINCVESYYKDTLLVARGDGTCSCLTLDHDMLITKELIGPNLDPIYDMSFSNDYIYTCCRDGSIRKYQLDITP